MNLMQFPSELVIRDVTLRDGLQNESKFVATDEKLNWIGHLIDAGFTRLEVTSFVHPKWVPTMRDAEELAQRLPYHSGVEFEALVPNRNGLNRLLNTPIHKAVFVISASTDHNKANLNRTTDESLDEIKGLIEDTLRNGKLAVGAISTSFVCPYSGVVPYSEVEKIAERLVESGVNEIGLGDTIGKATPKMVYEYCSRLIERFPHIPINLHLHDTYGYGLANLLSAIQAGVRNFDVAQAGLGGCPFAPGSPGNLQASRVVEFLEQQDIKTGLQLHKLKRLDIDFPQIIQKSELVQKV
jgi:hydroxymethylglutaryl-CoA lyase